jgi:2-keto-3-deoxy-L-rhamnonate aldolase RhmA
MSLRPNRAKARLGQGQPALGTWLMELRSPAVPQLLAQAGLHFIIVDMEHGPYSLETAADLIRTARLVDLTPIVRLPDLAWEHVGRVLDAGAQGLMLPRVRHPDEVRRFVSYLKYPPAGLRGMCSGLGNTDFTWVTTPEYIAHANAETLVLAQVETREALDHLDALAALPEVDVLFIGPEDLSIAMGHAGSPGHPEVVAAIDRVVAAAQAHGRAAGIHTSSLAALPALVERGLRFITYGSDVEHLFNGAAAAVRALERP